MNNARQRKQSKEIARLKKIIAELKREIEEIKQYLTR